MNLFVDIGNQRTKWATATQLNDWFRADPARVASELNAQAMEHHLASFDSTLDQLFADLIKPDSVQVASVAGDHANALVQGYCGRQWNLQAEFAVSGREFSGLVNGYDSPGELGVDRWLAMIGARAHIPKRALLVVDAGTAVTIDYIGKGGHYAGGVIFPGVSTMAKSLNVSTGQIRIQSTSQTGEVLQLQNTTTPGAVDNGVIHAVVSSIECAIDYFTGVEDGDFETIISGGDADLVFNLSSRNMHILPQLVLTGLMIFSGGTLP
jgi:type III pantothenate kinase